MPDSDEFLLRPVMRGLIKYESLLVPGMLSLEDIALLNEAIAVEQENAYRAQEAASRK